MLNAAAPQHKEVTHNQHGTRLIGWQARQLHNPLRTGKAKRGARAFARLFRHSSAFPHRHTCQQHPIHGNPGNKATWSHTMLHSCEFPSDLAIDLPGPSQPLRLQIADPISPHLPFTRRHWGSKGSHACSCATPQLGLCRALSHMLISSTCMAGNALQPPKLFRATRACICWPAFGGDQQHTTVC
eukprot:1151633-Pelagomonas_calceolata.AAC.4